MSQRNHWRCFFVFQLKNVILLTVFYVLLILAAKETEWLKLKAESCLEKKVASLFVSIK